VEELLLVQTSFFEALSSSLFEDATYEHDSPFANYKRGFAPASQAG
jgi:hypothetical protein